MITFDYEYIVVGSGPSGAMAAQTLVEEGKSVVMIDAGILGRDYESILPDGDFKAIRQNDPNQHRYFLGDDFESVAWGDIKVGAQLTPARQHLIKDVEKLIPLVSSSFIPMESLAYGGLGGGWGLGCHVYSDAELKKAGLNVDKTKDGYQVICDRIGISGSNDDVKPFGADFVENTQPPIKMDNSAQIINNKYLKLRKDLNKQGFYFGEPSKAHLTREIGNRKSIKYDDMEFYSNRDGTAYRPYLTINELKTKENFTYIGNYLALKFSENEGIVSLVIKNIQTSEEKTINCRKLLLAASPLGTARIVLRSFPNEINQLPILCNPYAYMPCINLKMLGTPLDRFRTSLGQAVLIYDTNKKHDDLVMVALFTYRSLLLYKLVKETPLNFADGLGVMNYLQSAFVVAGIHHPNAFSQGKYIKLQADKNSFTGDSLFAHYEIDDFEKKKIIARERVIRSTLRKLGCYPIKRIDPGFGSSIHYAGTVPFSIEEKAGTTHPNGRLHKTKNVFIADGSGLNYLPAKGITFTLMANAHSVAQEAMK